MLKEAADTELVQAVREVATGGRYVHPTLGARLAQAEVEAARRAADDPLSEREREVLRLLALGPHEPGDREAALHLRPHGRDPPRAHHAEARARHARRARALRARERDARRDRAVGASARRRERRALRPAPEQRLLGLRLLVRLDDRVGHEHRATARSGSRCRRRCPSAASASCRTRGCRRRSAARRARRRRRRSARPDRR